MDGGRDLGLGQKRREAERQREREARGHICNCTANGLKGCTKANITKNWHRVVPSHGTSTITALIKCYP